MNYVYVHETELEILTERELMERWDQWLDDVYGNVKIGDLEYPTSRVLREVDPIAYNVHFNDWTSTDEDNIWTLFFMTDQEWASWIKGDDMTSWAENKIDGDDQ